RHTMLLEHEISRNIHERELSHPLRKRGFLLDPFCLIERNGKFFAKKMPVMMNFIEMQTGQETC
ncbi:MAG: hypothetical protein ACPHL6_12365, partial [Rubripirellula sp.]